MTGTSFIKLLGLLLGVAAVNVLVLSPGFIGLEIGGSAFSAACGITLFLASALALLYGSYALLFKPPLALPVKEIRTHEDYIEALSRYKRMKALEHEITLALEQLDRLHKKKDTLLNVLQQRFDPAELSYKKFASTILEVEKLFYLNVRSILNRLSVFDESEFKRLQGRQAASLPKDLLQEKTAMYNEYLTFVKNSLGTNEEILLKLDKLLLEISRLDSFEPGDIENMPCMQEIDALIQQTKLYKQ
ncbi:hypothetical protein [Paenibacillus sp. R14(2021)]|uniref:hypothetical protein n=1 Tax=Paenibacillus sp. R14(2021) TaxID=2859228 RepID=UPI001C6159DD|nr:hypothetical protein [Paenibacillus sp. R14(2021)]